MTKEAYGKVKEEMKRMQATIKTYDAAYRNGMIGYASKEAGALKRASMDLTRALAEMRRT